MKSVRFLTFTGFLLFFAAIYMLFLSGYVVAQTADALIQQNDDQVTRTLPAFPGAEGYGRFALGGRGGDVYHVTNLNDSGPGSLRYGIKTISGPRTIVFDVSGTIELQSDLRIEDVTNLTIAGQSAPGDGITLKNRTLKINRVSDVIVRYIRVRLGDESKTSGDTIGLGKARNVIFDHITATWGVDGTMDTEFLSNFTLQWCIYGEALHDSTHHKGPHAMLMSFRKAAGPVTIHHNLLASSRNRHPTLGGGSQYDSKAIHDFRNNVIYNREGYTNLGAGQFILVGNYYRPGPNTNPTTYPIAPKTGEEDVTVGYMSGNFFEGHPEWTQDNYAAMKWGIRGGSYSAEVTREEFILSKNPVVSPYLPDTEPAEEAYESVLKHAGASLHRDTADQRIIRGVRNRTHLRINSQADVGGWPDLRSETSPTDTDRDGMPDTWETAHGLDLADPEDRNGDRDGDGYTNLEEYLNGILVR